MDINTIAASFLGGAVTSGVVFMFAFVGRVTKLEATLANLCATVKEMKDGRSVCQYHEKTVDKLNQVVNDVSTLRERSVSG